MMRDKLTESIKNPYFRLTLMVGVNGLIESARTLSSVGIDVNDLITQALREINSQLNGAAYEMTNLDELLSEAQAMGDEVVEKQQNETGNAVTPTKTEGDNSGKGNFGESE